MEIVAPVKMRVKCVVGRKDPVELSLRLLSRELDTRVERRWELRHQWNTTLDYLVQLTVALIG